MKSSAIFSPNQGVSSTYGMARNSKRTHPVGCIRLNCFLIPKIFDTFDCVGIETFKSHPRGGAVVNVVPPPIGLTRANTKKKKKIQTKQNQRKLKQFARFKIKDLKRKRLSRQIRASLFSDQRHGVIRKYRLFVFSCFIFLGHSFLELSPS